MQPSSSSVSMYKWKSFGSINVSPALLILFVSLSLISDNVNGRSDEAVIDSQVLTKRVGTHNTIIVDVNGDGDFKSIQDAIDSVPENNSDWVNIHVRKGIYREKVKIPRSKPNIFLRGSGKGVTSIVWSESSINNLQSATFIVEAHNFIAFGISFKNEAPPGIAQTSRSQSVAAFVGGNKVAFYHCAFFSPHNTLFDYKGIHYYHNCYIQGAIDLIFGRAQTLFDNCEVFVVGDNRAEIRGSITEHSRRSAGEKSGIVFVNGKVYGAGDKVYLGRAKEAFSRVIFANTYLSKSIVPQGWTNWSYDGSTDHVHHAEYNCHGPGAASAASPDADPIYGRAPWSKQLNHEEAAPFISIDYIRGKEWLPAWI